MSEWKSVKLGDCLEFLNGKSIKVQSCGVWPVYGSNGIIGYSEQYLYENAIVLGRVGAYCGSVARESGKFWASDNTIVVKSKDSVDIDFCYYQMKIMRLNNYAGGAAQPLITHSILNGLSLSLPSLATQRRIASVLSSYDSAIANCRRQIALLEEAAMRLYKEWFKDGKGEKKRLWDVCDYFRGVSYSSEQIATLTGMPLITLKNIERFGGFHEDRSKFFSGSCKQDSLASGGDVLMAVTDMTKERRLVGHVALVPDTYETAPYSMDLIKLKGKGVQDLFLYALLRYTNYSEQFAVRASGANVLHLKASSLDDISILVPPSKLQESFLSVFQPMVKQKNCLSRQIRALTEARDRLLPKLMKGEIAV